MRLSFKNKHWMTLVALAIIAFSCKKGEIGNDQQESFIKFYGSSSYDQAFEVKEVADGYILVGNTTRQNAAGNGSNTDMCIRKINKFGNEVWKYNYGNENLEDEANRFIIDDDGGFVMAGFSEFVANDTLNGDTVIFEAVSIVKTNRMGFLEWQQTFPLTIDGIGLTNSRANGIELDGEGNYLISGIFSETPINQRNPSDLFVLKISKETRTYEPADLYIDQIDGSIEVTSSFIFGTDNLIILGSQFDVNLTKNVPNFRRLAINDLTASAAKLKETTPFTFEEIIFGQSVDASFYIISNFTANAGSSSVLLEKLTPPPAGEWKTDVFNWSEDYQVRNESNVLINTFSSSFASTFDGGIIITGYTSEGQDRQVFLMKTDEEGNKQWEKTFGSPTQNEQGESVIETTDGGYLILGSAGFDGSRIGNTSVMVIKTNAEGEL